jgi:hypothetical protein
MLCFTASASLARPARWPIADAIIILSIDHFLLW